VEYSTLVNKKSFQVRFWDKIKITDSCWEWKGRTEYGYGRIDIDGKQVRVHRLSYELFCNDIPDKLVIDHLCRNRACVNPEHLEVVTNKENILRGMGASAINSRKTHCPKKHPLSGENLYIDSSTGGRRCLICKREKARLWKRKNKEILSLG